MKSLANFALFQTFWFLAIVSASRGLMWGGPLALLLFAVVHLRMLDSLAQRRNELAYILMAGLAGTLADSMLLALGATAYPTSSMSGPYWPGWMVPPWIVSLWIGFAMLPRFSLAWLEERLFLAAILGAIGGPLSYLAGTRFGVVAVGESASLTWGALALQYALATPLLLRVAPGRRADPLPTTAFG